MLKDFKLKVVSYKINSTVDIIWWFLQHDRKDVNSDLDLRVSVLNSIVSDGVKVDNWMKNEDQAERNVTRFSKQC